MSIRQGLIFFGVLLVLIPLGLFAQTEEIREVAQIRFWGDDPDIVASFGEGLNFAITDMEGFQAVEIDMDNLPPDVPEGGFPPWVSPGQSTTGDIPFAVTGELSWVEDDGMWSLRLYLWRMTDNRLLFSDQLSAADRDTLDMLLPGILGWLFSWMDDAAPAEIQIVEVPVIETVTEYIEVPVGDGYAPIPTNPLLARAPQKMLYGGLRLGWGVQLFDPQWSRDIAEFADWQSVMLAAQLNVHPLSYTSLPWYVQMIGLQAEAIMMQDFGNKVFSFLFPVMLKVTYRTLTSSFALMGGAFIMTQAGNQTEVQSSGLTFGHVSEPLLWGLMYGLSIGNIIGPGYLFMDMRLSNDMFVTQRTDYFNRYMVSVSIGYEIGFLRKK